MKRYIRLNNEISWEDLNLDKIVSIVLVDDLESYNPRDLRVYEASNNLDYSTMTRNQLLQLSEKELSNIHDVRILRKLHKQDLTPMQQRELTQANDENFKLSTKAIREVLAKLKDCHKVHIWDTEKNGTFFDKVWNLGGELRDVDAANIVSQLHIRDYSYSTYSHLDVNWNALLAVFEYKGTYTFSPAEPEGDPVTVESLDIYIKIDVDNQSRRGFAAMSFHDPEFDMTHPYKDYPLDKE